MQDYFDRVNSFIPGAYRSASVDSLRKLLLEPDSADDKFAGMKLSKEVAIFINQQFTQVVMFVVQKLDNYILCAVPYQLQVFENEQQVAIKFMKKIVPNMDCDAYCDTMKYAGAILMRNYVKNTTIFKYLFPDTFGQFIADNCCLYKIKNAIS